MYKRQIQTLAGVTSNGFSSSGFSVGFLLLIILVVGLYVAYTGLIKRETSKALHAVINFVVVFVLSASFIAYAPDYIKKINEFSSDISTASLDLGTKIMLPNSDSEGKDSVDVYKRQDMMSWANVSEKELSERKEIPTDFGETLSWEYLCFVRANPINWKMPTEILYAEHDNLTSRQTVDKFIDKHCANLTVMNDGEHWFHTDEQIFFRDNWLRKVIQ